MKRHIPALLSVCVSVPLFAVPGTYNDLGGYHGQNNLFWNTTAHASPAVDIAETPAVATMAAQGKAVVQGVTLPVLDTVVSDTDSMEFAAEFTSEPPGLTLIIR